MHPSILGDRCTTVAEFDNEVIAGLQRRARDENGKSILVPQDMTYEQWKKKYVTNSNNGGTINTQPKQTIKSAKTFKVQQKQENEIVKELKQLKVEYNPVQELKKTLTEDEIIKKIAGGDETKGSCASVALTYIGNKNGLDVLDFRGGESQNCFGTRRTSYTISQLPGIKSIVIENSNDIITANKLLEEVQEGKEYYLATGRHAAIVRRNNGQLQYLELQDKKKNGFQQFEPTTLKKRFGCKQTNTSNGYILKPKNILMEVDSFKDNDDFKEILGYINTQKDKQLKGENGSVK